MGAAYFLCRTKHVVKLLVVNGLNVINLIAESIPTLWSTSSSAKLYRFMHISSIYFVWGCENNKQVQPPGGSFNFRIRHKGELERRIILPALLHLTLKSLMSKPDTLSQACTNHTNTGTADSQNSASFTSKDYFAFSNFQHLCTRQLQSSPS